MLGGTSGLGTGELWDLRPRPHSSLGVLGAGNQDVTRIPLGSLLLPSSNRMLRLSHPAALLPGLGELAPRPLCLLPPTLPPPGTPLRCWLSLPCLGFLVLGPKDRRRLRRRPRCTQPATQSPSVRNEAHRGKVTSSLCPYTVQPPGNSAPSAH